MRICIFGLCLLLLCRMVFSAEPASKPQTRITFIGTSTANPAGGEDTACFIINNTFQVDCGFNSAINMQQYGFDPLKIRTLYFTHCHHDHYMGLPALLFFQGLRKAPQPLTIVGPDDDMPQVVELSRKFLQADRFPEVWPKLQLVPLKPGRSYSTDAFSIMTVKSRHPVTGVCSRLTDKATGVVIAFSGDTAPNDAFAQLARGADVMIHEASLSPATPDERVGNDHSRSIDAARTAAKAGVKQLILIHLNTRQRDASVEAAKKIFPNTIAAEAGKTIVLDAHVSE